MSANAQHNDLEIDESNRSSADSASARYLCEVYLLRWVQVGLCNDNSARGRLRTGDGSGWTIVRITILSLDT